MKHHADTTQMLLDFVEVRETYNTLQCLVNHFGSLRAEYIYYCDYAYYLNFFQWIEKTYLYYEEILKTQLLSEKEILEKEKLW